MSVRMSNFKFQAILQLCYFSYIYCVEDGIKIKGFAVEVESSEDVNELAVAMRKMLAYDRFLHIEFQMSSFCLGKKVIISVFTDDEKIFKKTYCCERPEISWVREAGGDTLFTKVLNIYFHSYSDEKHMQFFKHQVKTHVNM